jgi:hypothetical protein
MKAVARATMRLGVDVCARRIYPQTQSETGTDCCLRVQRVRKLVGHLNTLGVARYTPTFLDRRISYSCFRPSAGKLARHRILENQKGGDWTPFAVAFAPSWNVRSMEHPVAARTPGFAK